MTREVRCPLPECRRRIDIDALPAWPERPAQPPCLHFIAAWGDGRRSLAEEVLFGLDGNRELAIRNLRPREVEATQLEAVGEGFAEAVQRYAHIADATAAFGDPHERDAISRAVVQLILGPDPLASLTPGWRERT